MWPVCIVLAVLGVGFEDAAGPVYAADSISSQAADFPGPGRARPGFELGTGVRVDPKSVVGYEVIGLGPIRLRRSWRTSPDSTSSLYAAVTGPSLLAGLRPRASLTRSFPRHAPPRRRRSRRKVPPGAPFADTWRLGLDGPWARGSVTLGNGRGLRSWSAGLGSPAGRFGEGRLTRTAGASTAAAWRLRRERLQLLAGSRVSSRQLDLRAAASGGGRGISARWISPRITATSSARARRAPTQVRLASHAGPWRLGYSVRVRPDSGSMEGYLARRIAARPGTFDALAGFTYGPTREGRAHLSFEPRLRLGPIGFQAGAGVRVRKLKTRCSARPEFTAVARLRSKIFELGVGWSLRGVRRTARLEPGLAGALRAHPGPFEMEISLRPSASGLRWGASVVWRP